MVMENSNALETQRRFFFLGKRTKNWTQNVSKEANTDKNASIYWGNQSRRYHTCEFLVLSTARAGVFQQVSEEMLVPKIEEVLLHNTRNRNITFIIKIINSVPSAHRVHTSRSNHAALGHISLFTVILSSDVSVTLPYIFYTFASLWNFLGSWYEQFHLLFHETLRQLQDS